MREDNFHFETDSIPKPKTEWREEVYEAIRKFNIKRLKQLLNENKDSQRTTESNRG